VNTTDIVLAGREMMSLTLALATPFLAAAVVASLVVGLLQASTRMNDITLSFVPRFFAVLLIVSIATSWAAGRLIAYLERAATIATNLH